MAMTDVLESIRQTNKAISEVKVDSKTMGLLKKLQDFNNQLTADLEAAVSEIKVRFLSLPNVGGFYKSKSQATHTRYYYFGVVDSEYRIVSVGQRLHDIISPQIEVNHGFDFTIVKRFVGGKPDYSSSQFTDQSLTELPDSVPKHLVDFFVGM